MLDLDDMRLIRSGGNFTCKYIDSDFSFIRHRFAIRGFGDLMTAAGSDSPKT